VLAWSFSTSNDARGPSACLIYPAVRGERALAWLERWCGASDTNSFISHLLLFTKHSFFQFIPPPIKEAKRIVEKHIQESLHPTVLFSTTDWTTSCGVHRWIDLSVKQWIGLISHSFIPHLTFCLILSFLVFPKHICIFIFCDQSSHNSFPHFF